MVKNKNGNKPNKDNTYWRPSQKSSNEGRYIQQFTNYPTSVVEFVKVQRAVHPTQKPVPLLEYLIKTYTHENETVLDFTMGSGSTGVACVNTNRNFIGIELDQGYFDIAKERIEKAQNE
jgi:DNA modification methylase